jgi:hypothetical protein
MRAVLLLFSDESVLVHLLHAYFRSVIMMLAFTNSKEGVDYGLVKLHMLNAVFIPAAVENQGINIHVSLHLTWTLIRAPTTETAFQWKSVCHEIGFNLHYKPSVTNNSFTSSQFCDSFFRLWSQVMVSLVVITENCIQTKRQYGNYVRASISPKLRILLLSVPSLEGSNVEFKICE